MSTRGATSQLLPRGWFWSWALGGFALALVPLGLWLPLVAVAVVLLVAPLRAGANELGLVDGCGAALAVLGMLNVGTDDAFWWVALLAAAALIALGELATVSSG